MLVQPEPFAMTDLAHQIELVYEINVLYRYNIL
jgi:hypothetical protein